MLIQTAARRRPVLTSTVGALLLIAVAPPAVFAQDPQAASSATASSQSQGSSVGAQAGYLSEPHFIAKSIARVSDRIGDGTGPGKNGFYPEFSNMTVGAGWLAVGPGYRHHFSNDQILVDGSAAISWHLYKMVQARVELPKLAADRLVVGVQGKWQDNTQVNYFGLGPDSSEDDQSHYRIQTTDVVGYAAVMPHAWLSIGGKLGWLAPPKVMAPGGTFSGNFPDTRNQFPADPGVSSASQPGFLHGEASVAADTRNHPSHPTTGGLYRAVVTSFIDKSTGTFSFQQYEADGTQFIPLTARRWVLAFRGWTIYSHVPTGHQIPFYLTPAIGGDNTLRSVSGYRFHDNNLLLANAESRWALFDHLDAAVFLDTGNVAARYTDLTLGHVAYGAGVRLHTETATFARADVAYGTEGWSVVFRTSDPMRLTRAWRRTASVPFNP